MTRATVWHAAQNKTRTPVNRTPVYPPFFDWVPEAGSRLLEVPLAHTAAGWRLDLAALEAAFATHPAAYVLCNPHNPVGRVHTADELASLVRLARIYRVTIISDEIHGPLVLPGALWHPPEATFLAWLDCAALGPDDQARERFLEHGRVALEPGLRFGAAGSGYARLNFATSIDVLDQATARMARSAG